MGQCKSLAKFKRVWYTKGMLNWEEFRGKRICVAVSGGSDSVALLHELKEYEHSRGYRLSAVHCEHGIRGEESVADMRFVQALCQRLEVPVYLFREDCIKRAKKNKESLETAARSFRYDSFETLLRENKADFIATAHHQNDEAETVLFRLARGASLAGMSAMKEKNGAFLRPFLFRSKRQILDYLQKKGISYREDSTNLQTDATRNKLRLEILPKLEEAIPGATGNIARFAQLAAEDDGLLYELSKGLLTAEEKGFTVAFSAQKSLFTRACLTAMKALALEKDYTAAHLEALFDLQRLERGARLHLPKDIRAERAEKGVRLYVYAKSELPPLPSEKIFSAEGFDGGRYEVKISSEPFEVVETGWKDLRLDVEKLPKGAVFRFRKEGDYITCFGGGTKSLKKLFNERKIPVEERGYLPLIAEEKGGRVYAVCGVEISEQVKVDEATKAVFYILLRKKEN